MDATDEGGDDTNNTRHYTALCSIKIQYCAVSRFVCAGRSACAVPAKVLLSIMTALTAQSSFEPPEVFPLAAITITVVVVVIILLLLLWLLWLTWWV